MSCRIGDMLKTEIKSGIILLTWFIDLLESKRFSTEMAYLMMNRG